jgi:hypothetical protein
MRLLVRMMFLTLCCLGSCAAIASAHPEDSLKVREQGRGARAAVPQLLIERRGNLLSVHIHNAPWELVVQEVERRAGIKIHVMGRLAGTLTQEFEALPLEKGLWRLFREANTLIFYAPGTLRGASAAPAIRVWLFPREASGTAAAEHVGSLANSAGQEPLATLQTATQDADEAAEAEQEAPLQALHAFAQQGNGEALRQAIFDPDRIVQTRAFELLAAQDRQRAVAALLEVTQSAQPDARLQALELLHQSGQAEERTVLSALGEALADEAATVKAYAIQALAERGGADALGPLRSVLRDPDPSMRIMVIESVVQQEDALPLLQQALSDDNEMVRFRAASRLEQVAAERR